MKCYSEQILQKYLDGELPENIMSEICDHMNHCDKCSETLVRLSEENITIYEEINGKKEVSEEAIDNQWKVLRERIITSEKSNYYAKKPGGKSMKKINKALIAAAAITVFIGVPALGGQILQLFNSHVFNDDVVNSGITTADGTTVDSMAGGEMQDIDYKISDSGITVHITDLFTADSRLSLHYRIEDESGSLVPYEFDTSGLELVSDGKVDGVQKESPVYYIDKDEGTVSTLNFIQCGDNLPFELFKDGKPVEIGIRELAEGSEGTITFAGTDNIDYPVEIDISIDKIGTVQGSWKASIPVNTAK